MQKPKGFLYAYDEAERLFDCQLAAIKLCKQRLEVIAVYRASKKIFHSDSLYLYKILELCKEKTEEILNNAKY